MEKRTGQGKNCYLTVKKLYNIAHKELLVLCLMMLNKVKENMRKNKIRRFIGWGTCLASIILSSIQIVYGATEEELISSIEAQSGEPVFKYWYDDFDNDGSKELFAAVGTEVQGTTLWFSSDKETVNFPIPGFVYCDEGYGPEGICSINAEQKLFVVEAGGGGSGSKSMCFYVNNGIAIPAPLCGENLRQTAGTEFTINPSAFDNAVLDGIECGHTYKRYYLHWTGTEFTEYTGQEISLEELEKYEGGSDAIRQAESEGYSVGTIFRRDNGIINVNLYKDDESTAGADGVPDRYNDNITLEVKNDAVYLVVVNHDTEEWIEKYSYGGVYESAGLL